MSLPFTQWEWLTVPFRIDFAMNLAMINSDSTMDYIVDTGDTEDNANTQQWMEEFVHGKVSHELASMSLRSGFLGKQRKSVKRHRDRMKGKKCKQARHRVRLSGVRHRLQLKDVAEDCEWWRPPECIVFGERTMTRKEEENEKGVFHLSGNKRGLLSDS